MSDQLSAPRDPGSYGSRRRTGLGVGALVLFGIACVAGGYSLARFGPTLPELYPDKPRAGAVAEIAPLAAPAPASPVDEGAAVQRSDRRDRPEPRHCDRQPSRCA